MYRYVYTVYSVDLATGTVLDLVVSRVPSQLSRVSQLSHRMYGFSRTVSDGTVHVSELEGREPRRSIARPALEPWLELLKLMPCDATSDM